MTVSRLLTVAALALAPAISTAAAQGSTGGTNTTSSASGTSPFSENGMWIWQLPKSSGGNLDAIGKMARTYGVRTVILKSSDGSYMWHQFTPGVVQALKARGLRVCAWQYVYGRYPVTEAKLGAEAKRRGAQCLVIDAESEYEGRYSQAQRYILNLRARVGKGYPVGLAGFPYVDYHPGYPYSVFMGPGAAQYNVPQMYWKAIGTSVTNVYAHTYTYNSVYQRPIFPLGQLYMNPTPAEIGRFRRLARAYGAGGLSWWDWQETAPRGWKALGAPLAPDDSLAPAVGYPLLRHGSHGDLVVWAQEHLRGAGQKPPVTGMFRSATDRAVRAFQAASGLNPDGIIGDLTWQALLDYPPAKVDWTKPAGSRASAARAGANGPASAALPARRREIPPKAH